MMSVGTPQAVAGIGAMDVKEVDSREVLELLRKHGSLTFREIRRLLYHLYCSETAANVTAAQLKCLVDDQAVICKEEKYCLA